MTPEAVAVMDLPCNGHWCACGAAVWAPPDAFWLQPVVWVCAAEPPAESARQLRPEAPPFVPSQAATGPEHRTARAARRRKRKQQPPEHSVMMLGMAMAAALQPSAVRALRMCLLVACAVGLLVECAVEAFQDVGVHTVVAARGRLSRTSQDGVGHETFVNWSPENIFGETAAAVDVGEAEKGVVSIFKELETSNAEGVDVEEFGSGGNAKHVAVTEKDEEVYESVRAASVHSEEVVSEGELQDDYGDEGYVNVNSDVGVADTFGEKFEDVDFGEAAEAEPKEFGSTDGLYEPVKVESVAVVESDFERNDGYGNEGYVNVSSKVGVASIFGETAEAVDVVEAAKVEVSIFMELATSNAEEVEAVGFEVAAKAESALSSKLEAAARKTRRSATGKGVGGPGVESDRQKGLADLMSAFRAELGGAGARGARAKARAVDPSPERHQGARR